MVRVTTHLTQRSEETLIAGPPSAAISQTLQQEQQLSVAGMPPLQLLATSMVTLAMPQVDFADRADLDQLPAGEFADATIMTSATVAATTDGMPSTSTSTTNYSSRSRWTILERLPSLTILGNSYRRVVKVEVRVDSTDLATSQTTTVTNRFWLAAGIGAVRTELAGLTAVPILSELVESNLAL